MTFETRAETAARAVCGACLLVAFADGRFEPVEEGRLSSELAADDVFESLDRSLLAKTLQELAAALEADFETTSQGLLTAIRSVRDDVVLKKAVMHAARVAVIADKSVSSVEEQAVERIAEALGLEKGAL